MYIYMYMYMYMMIAMQLKLQGTVISNMPFSKATVSSKQNITFKQMLMTFVYELT